MNKEGGEEGFVVSSEPHYIIMPNLYPSHNFLGYQAA